MYTPCLSHLHLDHVGWNTTDQGGKLVPTFPNARYICHQADLDHFRKPEVQAAQTYPFMHLYVEPLVDLGLLDALTGDIDLTPEVKAIHTPGHTPSHMSVLVASAGQRALIQGDVIIHPAQITDEGWNSRFDVNWDLATETRTKLLDQIEANGGALVSCHFPAPGFGHVIRFEGKRYWKAGILPLFKRPDFPRPTLEGLHESHRNTKGPGLGRPG